MFTSIVALTEISPCLLKIALRNLYNMTAQVETPFYAQDHFLELKREFLDVREADPQPQDLNCYNREILFDLDDEQEAFYNYAISFLREFWRHTVELSGGTPSILSLLKNHLRSVLRPLKSSELCSNSPTLSCALLGMI